jgi:GNAT superfamily N-acetyltransferase
VPDFESVRFRLASGSDASAIAKLHTNSWRRFYRGAYSDQFLDGDVGADRLSVWRERLGTGRPSACTILAEDQGVVVGFVHAMLEEDVTWGALLENVHVSHDQRGTGIGTQLMALAAQAVIARTPSSGLYLWVLEQNSDAQAFYTARGGRCVERQYARPPGGDPDRLSGTPVKLRYVWPDPLKLAGYARSGRRRGRDAGHRREGSGHG